MLRTHTIKSGTWRVKLLSTFCIMMLSSSSPKLQAP